MRICVKRRHLKICFKKRIRIRIRKPGAGTVDKRLISCAGGLLKDKRGSMFPLAVAAALVMLFLILGVSEYMRLLITAAGIRDAMGSAVISQSTIITMKFTTVCGRDMPQAMSRRGRLLCLPSIMATSMAGSATCWG